MDPLAPPQTSEPTAPPWPVDQLAWLLAPSAPPGTSILLAPLGSLFTPAPPFLVVSVPSPQTSGPVPHSSTILAQSGSSSFPPDLSQSSLTPASPQSSGTLAPPWPLITVAPPWSPSPFLVPGLAIQWTPFRSLPITPSPRSVEFRTLQWLLPSAVPLWVTIILSGFWGL